MTDPELEQLAQRLGARPAERLDVERTAQAVLARLREERRRPVAAWVWMQPTWLKIAATAVLVLGAGLVMRGLVHEPQVSTAWVAPIRDDLSDLTAEQLREAMRSLEQPLISEGPGAAGGIETGLDGLSADELRALLRTLEG
ncbi:MAG TPA: hypothetical protein VFU41_14970 [Gemmatimonadales bacterium]|nr:hypothetical protein [Gemmatimonadales bacterium]